MAKYSIDYRKKLLENIDYYAFLLVSFHYKHIATVIANRPIEGGHETKETIKKTGIH